MAGNRIWFYYTSSSSFIKINQCNLLEKIPTYKNKFYKSKRMSILFQERQLFLTPLYREQVKIGTPLCLIIKKTASIKTPHFQPCTFLLKRNGFFLLGNSEHRFRLRIHKKFAPHAHPFHRRVSHLLNITESNLSIITYLYRGSKSSFDFQHKAAELPRSIHRPSDSLDPNRPRILESRKHYRADVDTASAPHSIRRHYYL